MQKLSAKMTPTEFLAWEREQPTRHDYIDGEIFDMAGGSVRHNRLSAKIISALERAVEGGPCGVYSSDQKIGLGDSFVYADASVVCPPIQCRPTTKDVIINPVLLVEVLSKSTEDYERGSKLSRYLALPSVHHLLFVAQHQPHVELYTRADDGTVRFEIFGEGANVTLNTPQVSFAVDALYAGVFELPGDEYVG